MTVQDGIPWRPARFDDFLQDPFERLREQQTEDMLERMEHMITRLEQIEQELDDVLKGAPTEALR